MSLRPYGPRAAARTPLRFQAPNPFPWARMLPWSQLPEAIRRRTRPLQGTLITFYACIGRSVYGPGKFCLLAGHTEQTSSFPLSGKPDQTFLLTGGSGSGILRNDKGHPIHLLVVELLARQENRVTEKVLGSSRGFFVSRRS